MSFDFRTIADEGFRDELYLEILTDALDGVDEYDCPNEAALYQAMDYAFTTWLKKRIEALQNGEENPIITKWVADHKRHTDDVDQSPIAKHLKAYNTQHTDNVCKNV